LCHVHRRRSGICRSVRTRLMASGGSGVLAPGEGGYPAGGRPAKPQARRLRHEDPGALGFASRPTRRSSRRRTSAPKTKK
jgi:hypothetical protein